MAGTASLGFLVVVLAVGGATAPPPPQPQVFTLKGYRFGGNALHGVNTAELVAKLKDHAGARVTKADIQTDAAILTRELKARHLRGQLDISMLAENHDRLWVVFDFWDTGLQGASLWASRHLESQHFEGVSRIPASALADATGLKPGDILSGEKVAAARKAIAALYAKSPSRKRLTIKLRIQSKPNDKAALIWIIDEQN